MIEADIQLRKLLVAEAVERLSSSAAAGRRRRRLRPADPEVVAADSRLARRNGRPPAHASHASSGRAA